MVAESYLQLGIWSAVGLSGQPYRYRHRHPMELLAEPEAELARHPG